MIYDAGKWLRSIAFLTIFVTGNRLLWSTYGLGSRFITRSALVCKPTYAVCKHGLCNSNKCTWVNFVRKWHWIRVATHPAFRWIVQLLGSLPSIQGYSMLICPPFWRYPIWGYHDKSLHISNEKSITNYCFYHMGYFDVRRKKIRKFWTMSQKGALVVQ